MASDRLGQRRGVEGLFQQGGKEHAGFGLLADLFGIGAQQQHRLAGHAWVQADLAGEVQTAAIGQPGVDDEEVVDIGLGLQQGTGLGQAGGMVYRTDQAFEHGHGAQCTDRVVVDKQAALIEERGFRRVCRAVRVEGRDLGQYQWQPYFDAGAVCVGWQLQSATQCLGHAPHDQQAQARAVAVVHGVR